VEAVAEHLTEMVVHLAAQVAEVLPGKVLVQQTTLVVELQIKVVMVVLVT
jgi:hypothetical protein